MSVNPELIPIAYKITDIENINNANIATVYINYEPSIQPIHILQHNDRLINNNNDVFNTKCKILFLSKLLQVIGGILIIVFLFYMIFEHV